jgi:hypothetical protein
VAFVVRIAQAYPADATRQDQSVLAGDQDVRVDDADTSRVLPADEPEDLHGIRRPLQEPTEDRGVLVVAGVEDEKMRKRPLIPPSLPLACSWKTLTRSP